MKTYNFKIYGNKYAVEVGEIEDNMVDVTVNGAPYKVELDMESRSRTESGSRSSHRRWWNPHLPAAWHRSRCVRETG